MHRKLPDVKDNQSIPLISFLCKREYATIIPQSLRAIWKGQVIGAIKGVSWINPNMRKVTLCLETLYVGVRKSQ